jgi:hypothetical protein
MASSYNLDDKSTFGEKSRFKGEVAISLDPFSNQNNISFSVSNGGKEYSINLCVDDDEKSVVASSAFSPDLTAVELSKARKQVDLSAEQEDRLKVAQAVIRARRKREAKDKKKLGESSRTVGR